MVGFSKLHLVVCRSFDGEASRYPRYPLPAFPGLPSGLQNWSLQGRRRGRGRSRQRCGEQQQSGQWPREPSRRLPGMEEDDGWPHRQWPQCCLQSCGVPAIVVRPHAATACCSLGQLPACLRQAGLEGGEAAQAEKRWDVKEAVRRGFCLYRRGFILSLSQAQCEVWFQLQTWGVIMRTGKGTWATWAYMGKNHMSCFRVSRRFYEVRSQIEIGYSSDNVFLDVL